MMHGQTLTRHYAGLTPEERVRLTLAASARGDREELTRLMAQGPKMLGPDPKYPALLNRLGHASAAVLLSWLEVSHLVIRAGLAVRMCEQLGEAYESQHRVEDPTEGEDRQELEAIVRACREGRATAAARRKAWSARWKGIESAITSFCAEIHITSDQLFALQMPLPLVIEKARQDLDADAAVGRKAKQGVERRLRQAWLGYAEPR